MLAKMHLSWPDPSGLFLCSYDRFQMTDPNTERESQGETVSWEDGARTSKIDRKRTNGRQSHGNLGVRKKSSRGRQSVSHRQCQKSEHLLRERFRKSQTVDRGCEENLPQYYTPGTRTEMEWRAASSGHPGQNGSTCFEQLVYDAAA